MKKSNNVWNYKYQAKLPTKKEEQDFVNSLRPDQKTYSVIYKKPYISSVPPFKIIYYSLWERIIRKLLKKGSYDE